MNNSESTEIRKLAAVMFTDIEGYTTMFHQDEINALSKIGMHRKDIEVTTSKYNGQIVQFYGDGSLVIFDSVVDAVKTAVEIQNVSREKLPVRIGIHLGDLILKEGSVFGDVVNVASRLQAIGTPGSIVVSKKVNDEIGNQPWITTMRLGLYTLKNVSEPLELYAITGHGLNIPQQKPVSQKKIPYWMITLFVLIAFGLLWYFSNNPSPSNGNESLWAEKIAVPPFENFTTDPAFNPVAQMAGHWITTELIELAEANVVSYNSSSFYTNTSEASMPLQPQFVKQTGAVNIIKGAFSHTGAKKDSLVFWASIIDSRSGQPLQIEFDKAYCDANDPLVCIRQLSNEIKGFWKSKSDKVLSPPTYDAYKEYLLARNTWDGIDDAVPEQHLREAIRLDPNFLDAYFLLLDLFYNRRSAQEASDTLRSIRKKFTDLTPRQENYLRYHEEDVKGRRTEAFKYFMKEYALDPKDIFVNTSGMVMALTYLNDPDRVIAFHEEIDVDSIDLNSCSYCLERVMMALQAYTAKKDLINAAAMADKIKLHAINRDDYHRLIEWYMLNGDSTSVNRAINKAGSEKLDRDFRYLAFVAGRQAMLNDNKGLRDYYAEKTISLYGNVPSRGLARAYLLKEDYENAKLVFDQVLKEDSTDHRIYGDLGIIYAKTGDTIKAQSMIFRLDQVKEPFDYGETAYMQAKIKLAMNEPSQAINYLKKSIEDGMLFYNSVSFSGDPDLIALRDNAEYKTLLTYNKSLAK